MAEEWHLRYVGKEAKDIMQVVSAWKSITALKVGTMLISAKYLTRTLEI